MDQTRIYGWIAVLEKQFSKVSFMIINCFPAKRGTVVRVICHELQYILVTVIIVQGTYRFDVYNFLNARNQY